MAQKECKNKHDRVGTILYSGNWVNELSLIK